MSTRIGMTLVSILALLAMTLMPLGALAQEPPVEEGSEGAVVPVPTAEVTEEPGAEATEEPSAEATEEVTGPSEEGNVIADEEPSAPIMEDAPASEEPVAEEAEAIEAPVDVAAEEPVAEEAEEIEAPVDAAAEEPAVEEPEEIGPDGLAIGDVGAAAATSKALSSNFTMVNLGTSQANVSLDYRRDNGTAWPVGTDYAGPFVLSANGGSKQLRQYFDTAMPAGRGSVVISSDQQLGAVAQVLARNQTPSSGSYSGATAGTSLAYVPLVAKLGSGASGVVNSEIVIQNTGTANVTVQVKFYNNSDGNLRHTKSGISILGSTSFYYDLTTEAGLPSNWFGSAVVETTSAGGEVAVVSNLFTGPHAMQTFNGFAQSEATTKWMNPSFFSRLTNGLSTVMTVQNVSGSNWAVNSVTASCVRTQGSGPATLTLKNNQAVKNNAPFNFNPVANTPPMPTNWIGACTVTTPGNSVLFVQMRFVGAPYPEAGAFNALRSSGSAKKCSAPLIAKRLSNGFATVFTVQNLNSAGIAHVTFQYKVNAAESKPGTTNVTVGPYAIPAGASLQHNHRLPGNGGSGVLVHNLPDGWVGSVVVTSSDQSIDCYGQLTFYSNKSGDQFMSHNGFTY